jgi:hypothetical protein
MTRSGFFKAIAAACIAPLAGKGETVKPPQIQEVPAGKLYAIEFPGYLPQDAEARIQRNLEPLKKKFDCEFVVLDGGAHLVDPNAPRSVHYAVDARGAGAGAEQRIKQALIEAYRVEANTPELGEGWRVVAKNHAEALEASLNFPA